MDPSIKVQPALAENLRRESVNSTKRQMKHARWMITILFAAFFIPLAVFLPGLILQQACAAEQRTYSFGIVPQFEQRRLYATWKPIIDDLEKRTGLKFRLVTTLNIRDFEKAFFHGDLDFMYANPYYFAKLPGAPAYIPLVADKTPLRGILVARKDGPIQKPSDLDGKTVAFPSANALGASLLVRSALDRVFHVRVEPLYVTTHSSVYLHVAKDLAAAGGGVEKTFLEQDQSIRSQLRVIYTTRPFPSHPVAAHPRVPESDREKVRQALLDMNQAAASKEMLLKVPVQEFIPVHDEDYAIMHEWGLQKYWQPVKEGN